MTSKTNNSEASRKFAEQTEAWEAVERCMGIPIAEKEPERLARFSLKTRLYLVSYKPSPEICGWYIRLELGFAADGSEFLAHLRLDTEAARSQYDKMEVHHVDAQAFERYIEELQAVPEHAEAA